MQPKQPMGVPNSERPSTESRADWEAVHVFLEVVRCGSFRAAADRLGHSVNALRRRVDALERQMGVTILTRHVDGVRLTAEGQAILGAATRMEEASYDLVRARDRTASMLSGRVRLAVTEGMGTFWVVPRLIEFQRAHPRLLVQLNCAMQSADVLRLEADAAVQLTRPTSPNLKVVKIGRLHSMPFAGQPYVDTYGLPTTYEEMKNHRFVVQPAEQTQQKELFQRLFPDMPWIGFVAMTTNTSSALVWSIAKGGGIGWLPTYVHAIGGRLVPIDIDHRYSFDIWLTYHRDAKRIPRVRRMIDWVVDAFDPGRFPWFRDEFIHPNDLPGVYRGPPLVNMFEGFVGANSDARDLNQVVG